MLKPRKGFVQNELNIERLTPLQWDGIMRAMDSYAKHCVDEFTYFIDKEHGKFIPSWAVDEFVKNLK